jgi:hypothetical protein
MMVAAAVSIAPVTVLKRTSCPVPSDDVATPSVTRVTRFVDAAVSRRDGLENSVVVKPRVRMDTTPADSERTSMRCSGGSAQHRTSQRIVLKRMPTDGSTTRHGGALTDTRRRWWSVQLCAVAGGARETGPRARRGAHRARRRAAWHATSTHRHHPHIHTQRSREQTHEHAVDCVLPRKEDRGDDDVQRKRDTTTRRVDSPSPVTSDCTRTTEKVRVPRPPLTDPLAALVTCTSTPTSAM